MNIRALCIGVVVMAGALVYKGSHRQEVMPEIQMVQKQGDIFARTFLNLGSLIDTGDNNYQEITCIEEAKACPKKSSLKDVCPALRTCMDESRALFTSRILKY